MKKIFCVVIVLFSLCSFSQNDNNKVVAERMFSVNERVSLQLAFDSHLTELNLSDDQLYKYTTIIDDNVFYMMDYNKKGDKTKAEIEKNMSKIISKQDKELKKLLTPEQYKKHLEIYNATIYTPIMNRFNAY